LVLPQNSSRLVNIFGAEFRFNNPSSPSHWSDSRIEKLKNDFVFSLGPGLLFTPYPTFGLVFELVYQVRNPQVSYYFIDESGKNGEVKSDTINLNTILWKIGIQFKILRYFKDSLESRIIK